MYNTKATTATLSSDPALRSRLFLLENWYRRGLINPASLSDYLSKRIVKTHAECC